MGEIRACPHGRFEPLARYPRQTTRTGAVMLTAIRTSLSAAALVAAVSTSAVAGPLPLFPFEPAPCPAPRAAAYAPVEVEEQAVEAPAPAQAARSRFKRQVVNYPTHEAPGTVVIDTPNTYLYLVLGDGKALRYGVGVGRE